MVMELYSSQHTVGGLLRWDTITNAFVPSRYLNSDEDYQLTYLHVANGGNIWTGTKDKIIRYSKDFHFSANWHGVPDITKTVGTPYTFIEVESGELIVGSSFGLAKLSNHNKTVTKYDLSPLGIQGYFGVTAIELDIAGNLLIGTDTGDLAVLDLASGIVVAHATLGRNSPKLVSDFAFHDDKLLIATDEGLYLSDTDLSNISDISLEGAGLSSSDVTSLYQDGDHVWVGTYNGLDILSSAPFELFNNKNSGINNDVLSFEQDSSGRIWVGTYGGLYFYDESRKSHSKFEIQFESAVLVDQRVTALAASKGQQLWVGFYRGGLQSINTMTGETYAPKIENASEMFVMDLFEDKAKNLWIATQTHGLIRVTSDKIYYYYSSGILIEKGVSLIFSGLDKLIVVSTKNKIYEYNYNTNRFSILDFDFGFGLDKTVIFSISQSQNGDIWFGTKDHGLFQWRNSDQKSKIFRLNHVGKGTELEYATIYGISSDVTGSLWCSTQSGVLKLSSSGQPIKRFTMADGLQGGDFTLGASFTSQAGLIYFGGMNGYNRFDPSQIEIDSSESPMRMTGISFPEQDDNKSMKGLSDIRNLQLTYKDQVCHIPI
jgi:ligand-binding sensor domain-containing protein